MGDMDGLFREPAKPSQPTGAQVTRQDDLPPVLISIFSCQVTRLPPSSTQLSEQLLPASASSSFLLPFLFPFHCPALSFPLLP